MNNVYVCVPNLGRGLLPGSNGKSLLCIMYKEPLLLTVNLHVNIIYICVTHISLKYVIFCLINYTEPVVCWCHHFMLLVGCQVMFASKECKAYQPVP